ncbi:hydroxyacid dehydrogenase [Acidobacteriia bacterium AH_259_A11_L15]|nr:hydroxyacid dehydrogenase [Acidobacteriia bacterium AH_259_A11_L15]
MKAAFLEVKEWEREYLKERLPGHEFYFSGERLQGDMLPQLREFQVLSPFIYSRVTGEVVQALPSLQLVTTRSTGFDHVDMGACAARGIAVANVPSYGENTVAEHSFALMLALSRKIHQSYLRAQRGDFSLTGLTGFDLKGKTLGVVGAGKIGLHVIKIGRGFGMSVLAYDPYRNPFLAELLGFRYVEMDELLAASDVVTLHMPYRPALEHFMDREKFRRMKPGALFINTARGHLVDTDALLEALQSGRLAGAGLDVVEGEELIQEEEQLLYAQDQRMEKLQAVVRTHVLFRHEKVIFTPHNAFNSKEALERILETTVENILAFERGQPLNLVKAPGSVPSGAQAAAKQRG